MYMYFLCRYAGSLQSCNICFCIATDWSISFKLIYLECDLIQNRFNNDNDFSNKKRTFS